MAANRYTAAHKNFTRNEVSWTMEIYDDLGSPVGTFECGGQDGVVITNEGPTRDNLPGIYPSYATFNFMVTNAQQELMISDIRDKDRSRFALRVYRDAVLVFVGRFASHDIQIENMPYPFAVNLTANDGLATLNNIRYDNSGTPYTGYATCLEHIQNCFDKLDIQAFYTGDFIDFTVQWFNQEHADTTTNPLEVTRIDHRAFTPEGDDAAKCWDVLEKICILWGVRLYYAEGMFHFEQLSERTDANFNKWVYDTDFMETASSGTDSVEISIAPASGTGPLRGGIFGALDALSEVEVKVEFEGGNLAEGYAWDYNDSTAKNLGVVTVEDEDDVLQIKASFEYRTLNPNDNDQTNGWKDHRYIWRLTVILDDGVTQHKIERQLDMGQYYTVTGINGHFFLPQYGPVDWDSVEVIEQPSDVYTLNNTGVTEDDAVIKNTLHVGPGGSVAAIMQITSLPLNNIASTGDTLDLSLQINLDKVVAEDDDDITFDVSDFTFQWWARNVELKILQNEGGSELTTLKRIFRIQNDVVAERILSIESFFSDLPNKANGLQVYDGTDWKYSFAEWGVDTLLGSKNISLLLAEEIMKLRRVTKRIYNGEFITHEGRQDARISYDSSYWIGQRTALRSGTDLFGGRFLELSEDDTSGMTPTEVDVDVNNNLPPLVAGPGNPDAPLTFPMESHVYVRNDISTAVMNIENNAGLTYEAGVLMKIRHVYSGKVELFQITEAIDGTSPQAVDIVTKTFTNTYPINSEISFASEQDLRKAVDLFTVDASDVSNNYLDLVKGDLIDPQYFDDPEDYKQYCEVYRGGGNSELVYSDSAQADLESQEHGVVVASDRVLFPDDFPLLVGEIVKIVTRFGRL